MGGVERGFVFSGATLMLAIPAIILAAYFMNALEYGSYGISISMRADVVFYIQNDLKETETTALENCGRYITFMTIKNMTDRFDTLLSEYGATVAKSRGFFPYADMDGEGRSSEVYVRDKIAECVNDALISALRQLSNKTGMVIIIKDNSTTMAALNGTGNLIERSDITLMQYDPWGFNLTLASFPLLIMNEEKKIFYNTSLPTSKAYVSIEDLQDPYIYINSEARSSNKIERSIFLYDLDSDGASNNIINPFYIVLIGSGSESEPRPYYYQADDGISFFGRLNGGTEPYADSSLRIETFVTGNPLELDSTSLIDHYYFSGIAGDPICINDTYFTDPLGNVVYIDDTHLSFYGLNRSYNCTGAPPGGKADIEVFNESIYFSDNSPIEGDIITITATIYNVGSVDANNVLVSFYVDTISASTKIGDATIATLSAGSFTNVSINWDTSGYAGVHTIYVYADPSDTISESDETNNIASKDITVSTSPSTCVYVSPYRVRNCYYTSCFSSPRCHTDTLSNILYSDDSYVINYHNGGFCSNGRYFDYLYIYFPNPGIPSTATISNITITFEHMENETTNFWTDWGTGHDIWVRYWYGSGYTWASLSPYTPAGVDSNYTTENFNTLVSTGSYVNRGIRVVIAYTPYVSSGYKNQYLDYIKMRVCYVS